MGAAIWGHLEIVWVLLEWGVDKNVQNKASGYSSRMLLDAHP
jgi:hypothetical protein